MKSSAISRLDILSIYKKLLREIELYCPKNKSFWRNELRAQFKEQKTLHFYHDEQESNATMQTFLRYEQANEAFLFMKNLQHQKKMLETYKIGVFIDEREKLRKSSERVGLRHPKFSDEQDIQ